MVYLDADKQTYADLNVTGNVYGEQALCSLFLKAETKKGKSLMLDWIMHPLSDWEEICKRQEAIAWDFLPELPLNEEELDFIEYYLESLKHTEIDAMILGCTHYPLLRSTMRRLMGEDVTLVNPAYETAIELRGLLAENGLSRDPFAPFAGEKHQFFVSDLAEKFTDFASSILPEDVTETKKINIEEY
mgnify:CR=1 FL=1